MTKQEFEDRYIVQEHIEFAKDIELSYKYKYKYNLSVSHLHSVCEILRIWLDREAYHESSLSNEDYNYIYKAQDILTKWIREEDRPEIVRELKKLSSLSNYPPQRPGYHEQMSRFDLDCKINKENIFSIIKDLFDYLDICRNCNPCAFETADHDMDYYHEMKEKIINLMEK